MARSWGFSRATDSEVISPAAMAGGQRRIGVCQVGGQERNDADNGRRQRCRNLRVGHICDVTDAAGSNAPACFYPQNLHSRPSDFGGVGWRFRIRSHPQRFKCGFLDLGGTSQAGAGLSTSERHWHTAEDEFVWVVEGEVVLVSSYGEEVLRSGDCAGFAPGPPDGHHPEPFEPRGGTS